MKKEFYIILPYDNEQNSSVKDDSMMWVFTSFWKAINSGININDLKIQNKNFKKTKKWLFSRVSSIKTWLENIWIKAKEINKHELITFLTDYYNPNLENITNIKQDIDKYNLTQ
jgi:hypothetical protein